MRKKYPLINNFTVFSIVLFLAILAIGGAAIVFMPNCIYDYKTAMIELFFVMLAVISLIIIVFNIFINRFAKSLHKTMESLETVSKAKSEFLAKMSHEIRTPMNAIIGMAELALRKDTSHSVHKEIITVKQAGTNLLSIINDILDISKIESGKMEIVPVSYMFSSLVNDVISIIRMKVIDSRLRFTVNIDSTIPNALFGDETRVRQILLNILSNAVKYTKKGFISLSVRGEIIGENMVLLIMDVADSGIGIKQENIRNLFDNFVQFDLAKNKGVEGTGLGLAITKNLVEMMDGDINVHSEYGNGSTFTITLPQKIRSFEPLAKVENPEEKSVIVYEQRQIHADSVTCNLDNLGVSWVRVRSDEELYERLKIKDYTFIFVACVLLKNTKKILSELDSKARIVVLTGFCNAITYKGLSTLEMPTNPMLIANILNDSAELFYGANTNTFRAPKAKVLVVDDINTNLQVAEGLLLPYEMQVDLRFSGTEAIQAVKVNSYDLVFMDHMMPGMDGVEATKRIRELGGEYLSLPIVALTANALSGTKEMFLANGFNDFLSKPIDTVKLNAILGKLLPKEKQEEAKEEINDRNNLNTAIKIEGVDVNRGIAIAGGKVKNYLQTLAVFHEDGILKIEEIKKSLETDNYHLYTIHIHALKSASANIGAKEISEAAKALEDAGRHKDLKFIESNNAPFLEALQTLLDNIDEVLSEICENEQRKFADYETLKIRLGKLKEAFSFLDPDIIDEAVNGLREFTQAIDIGANVEKILQNTLKGKYNEATYEINNLLK